MVKNTQGCNRHKAFARKHTNSKSNNKLRISQDEGELYAIVTKLLGNNMFHCQCIDRTLRLGHIRGKFTGRGKRDNLIVSGTWVLVGIREWDASAAENDLKLSKSGKSKLPQCDLLEVYSDMDKERLKDSVAANWTILNDSDVTKTLSGLDNDEDIINFTTENVEERVRLIEEMNSNKTEKITLSDNLYENEEEVNIDDI
jgi:initiation factor 1A